MFRDFYFFLFSFPYFSQHCVRSEDGSDARGDPFLPKRSKSFFFSNFHAPFSNAQWFPSGCLKYLPCVFPWGGFFLFFLPQAGLNHFFSSPDVRWSCRSSMDPPFFFLPPPIPNLKPSFWTPLMSLFFRVFIPYWFPSVTRVSIGPVHLPKVFGKLLCYPSKPGSPFLLLHFLCFFPIWPKNLIFLEDTPKARETFLR